MADAREILEAIIRHTSVGGTLSGGSPLIAMAEQAVRSPTPSVDESYGLTDAQLAMRTTGVGASESPMLAGVSPFGGPIDLYLRKVGLADERTTDAQEMGNLLEAGIVRWYERKTDAATTQATTLRDEEHPWLLATPDRFVNGRQKLLQVKLVGRWMAHHWDGEMPPDYVLIQVQQEMRVARVPLCDVAVLIGGTEPKIYQVEYDEDLAESIVEIVRSFWFDHVVPRIPPPVDGSESATELLKKIYPFRRSLLLDADDEAERWAREYLGAGGQISAIEKRRDIAEQHLKLAIGDAEGIRGAGWKATWKANKNGVRSFKCSDDTAKKGKAAA